MTTVSDYLFAKASKNRIPLQGSFELTPVCNFSCKMCYVRKSPEQIKAEGKYVRDWKEWLELARQCKEAGMLYVLLTGGEPFIYPGFRKLYEALHNMGIVIKLNSNGTMIDEETVEWLKTMAPSRINITLYGSKPETYKKLCGRADGYEKAKNAIIMLKEAGIPVVINASMIPENADDLEDIIIFGKEHGLNVRMATYMFPPVRRESEVCDSRFTSEEAAKIHLRKLRCLLNDEDYRNSLESQLAMIGEVSDDDDTWGSNLDHMCCRAGRSTFWVSWEGVMTACGMMSFPLETKPFEEPFIECWKKLNDKVRSAKVMEACVSCDKKEFCHPCIAQIFAETGDVHDKAPYICDMTDKTIEYIKAELKNNGKK